MGRVDLQGEQAYVVMVYIVMAYIVVGCANLQERQGQGLLAVLH